MDEALDEIPRCPSDTSTSLTAAAALFPCYNDTPVASEQITQGVPVGEQVNVHAWALQRVSNPITPGKLPRSEAWGTSSPQGIDSLDAAVPQKGYYHTMSCSQGCQGRPSHVVWLTFGRDHGEYVGLPQEYSATGTLASHEPATLCRKSLLPPNGLT
ncbi:LOW QUALITY PROTEIN: hypothetical protein CVT26_001308 [Gymnopilus dilepis]|uniref:Uncharacterized protein n=1 Tax=Gymnopilus dilepis TaxID=231916 RepID=A0A409Y1Y1_9AGAR|nr:LOW QUALITY PROTEIN: hypothetical protein CVT26_001308 [Gymnopilus dilepis]